MKNFGVRCLRFGYIQTRAERVFQQVQYISTSLGYRLFSSKNSEFINHVPVENGDGVVAESTSAESVLLDMLLNHSHWKRGKGGEEKGVVNESRVSIYKSFELRDARTAERFENMVKDFLLKLETRQGQGATKQQQQQKERNEHEHEDKKKKRDGIISLQIDKRVGGSPSIDVSVICKNRNKGKDGGKTKISDSVVDKGIFIISQEEIDAAMAVDMIAAELQLGGNPNWS
jgi:hypothetical protein